MSTTANPLSPPFEYGKEEGISEDSPLFYDKNTTTVIKAVPFVYTYNADVEEYIEKYIHQHVSFYGREESAREYNRSKDIRRIVGVNRGGNMPLIAGHVLQVKDIIISKNSYQVERSKIRGEISLTDYQNNTFYIFKNEKGDRVYDIGCSVAPVVGGKLNICLRDVDGCQIFQEDTYYYLNGSCDDRDMIRDFRGKDGYVVRLVYTNVPFAGLARVTMYLHRTPPDDCGEEKLTYMVHGSIKVNNVECFQRDSLKALDMEYGEYDGFVQSRDVFAVPMGSKLRVEYELHQGDDTFVQGDKDVDYPNEENRYLWDSPEDLDVTIFKDDNYDFGMLVNWSLHDDIFYEQGRWSSYLLPDFVKWSPDKKNRQPSEVLSQLYQAAMIGDSAQMDQPPRALPLVEIFSIVLFGGSVSAPLPDLCGKITVRDRGGEIFCIFSRDKKCPDKLISSNQEQQFRTVSVAWPDDDRWLMWGDLLMNFNLTDVHGSSVCKGSIIWDPFSREWFGRRKCEAIQGTNGCYAAVHYAVFMNGKKAKVTVMCYSGAGVLVYGSIHAEYDGYDYPSTYDKECYRSIIFKRPREDCLKIKKNGLCEIPLSKSYVSVPPDCENLIIVSELCVLPYLSSPSYRPKTEKFTFSLNKTTRSQSKGRIWVNVDWS